MARFLSLHVLLIGSVVLYIILGAIVFQMLEGEHLDALKKDHMAKIEQNAKDYVDKLWSVAKRDRDKYKVRWIFQRDIKYFKMFRMWKI